MFLELKIVDSIYREGNVELIEKFSLTDLPLCNQNVNEVDNSSWQNIQDKLGFSGLIQSLIPKQFKLLERMKTISKHTSSFNKRAEHLTFGKVGKFTGQYYIGDYDSSDMFYSDFEFVVVNEAKYYDPVTQSAERHAAEKSFESILAKLLFISTYKYQDNENTTWAKKLEKYKKEHVNPYLKTDNSNETVEDYFNSFIASEITNSLMVMVKQFKQPLTTFIKDVVSHNYIENLFGTISEDMNEIISKIESMDNMTVNPLKVHFAVYDKDENGNKRYFMNHLKSVYDFNQEKFEKNILNNLNYRTNEFMVVSMDLNFSKEYTEHTYQRLERGETKDINSYKYPAQNSVMFPEYIKVKLSLRNDRKFTFNEWVKYYKNLATK